MIRAYLDLAILARAVTQPERWGLHITDEGYILITDHSRSGYLLGHIVDFDRDALCRAKEDAMVEDIFVI